MVIIWLQMTRLMGQVIGTLMPKNFSSYCNTISNCITTYQYHVIVIIPLPAEVLFTMYYFDRLHFAIIYFTRIFLYLIFRRREAAFRLIFGYLYDNSDDNIYWSRWSPHLISHKYDDDGFDFDAYFIWILLSCHCRHQVSFLVLQPHGAPIY
jgi:hypothetical protein